MTQETKKTVLTGIKPTGALHLGNWVGAIQPALTRAHDDQIESFLFIADYHALTTVPSREAMLHHTHDVAAAWIAMGLDPQKTIFYRQSRVPQTFELAWILGCVTPKGLMNRAHAYKALVAENQEKEVDIGIGMGVYNYPILMAADILLFDATHVPVGRDQIQHVEIARDIAIKLNQAYGDILTLPSCEIKANLPVLQGLDGRKMSKSYNNTIPLFVPSDVLRKKIFKIKTNSLAPSDPKETEGCTLFQLYSCVASPQEREALAQCYQEGIGWGDVKEKVFEQIERFLAPHREIYYSLITDVKKIEKILKNGEKIAFEKADTKIRKLRKALGVIGNF